MKRHKLTNDLIILINLIGVGCLLYYGWFYIIHDQSIVNPEAMLALERWDASGFALTIGLIPLIIVNSIAYITSDQRKGLSLLWLIPCIICVCLVGHYWLGSLLNDHDEISSQAVVKVAYQTEDGETHFSRLYDDGGLEEVEPFAFDDVIHYEFEHNCFESRIVDHKVVNKLNKDEINLQVDDSTIMHLLELIVKDVNHDIVQVEIYKDAQSYFMTVKTNVNWQDPCLFYQYISEDDELNCLYQWDGIDIIGIAL